MLALDFDGVVCDALLECAAVTWYGAHLTASQVDDELPDLATAVAGLPPGFLTTFSSVRAHSRTLQDFMVSTVLAEGSVVGESAFAATARGETDRLASCAAVGELVRERWRTLEPGPWLDLHTVYAGVRELLLDARSRVAIVSAKDELSIRDVLRRHGLEGRIAAVHGSLADKRPTLSALAARGESVVFVDDNLGHVRAAGGLTGVTACWATWGYHTPEDAVLADQLAVISLAPRDLPSLAAMTPSTIVARTA